MTTGVAIDPTCDKKSFILKNSLLYLEIGADGSMKRLSSSKDTHNYSRGNALFRLYFRRKGILDREILASDSKPKINVSGARIELSYPSLVFEGKKVNIAVRLIGELSGYEIHWNATLENMEPGLIISDFHFPAIRIRRKNDQKLLWSHMGGQWLDEPEKVVESEHSLWMGQDHNFRQLKTSYPGQNSAMNCFTFAGPEEGFYFGLHGQPGEITEHLFRMYGDELDVSMVRFPNCSCGEVWKMGTYCLSIYSGDWHVAAQKYRKWAESSWFSPHEIPEWVKRSTGWQRIIMKHQYGEIHYRFSDLPKIFHDGQKAGINSLLLFGWQRGGHDNNYPDYEPDPDLGTEEELIDGIRYFNEHGGQVILYSNGQLIDINSEFYSEYGKDVELKDIFGNARLDAYRFRANGCFAGEFANRTFVHACPYAPEWKKVLSNLADKAYALGCKSVFYDQVGRTAGICFGENHGHKVPALDTASERVRDIEMIRKYIRAKNPEMSIGIEILADISGTAADYVHSLSGYCKATNKDWEAKGEKPEHEFFIDWFRYTFPEIIISDREIRDDTDIERRVNHLVLKGLRSDVEIYRCRRTIVEAPHYQNYLGEVNRVRNRYSHLLLEGKYQDTEGFYTNNEDIEARSFISGNEMAVVLTQSHLESTTVKVKVNSEWKYKEHQILSCSLISSEENCVDIELKKHGLALIIFTKSSQET